SFWAVAMAYLVGMLANSLPIPAGLVAVEGGLFGMLLLFGVRPGSLVLAAVVTYRAISLWVPASIGSLAFLSLRRELNRPVAPAARSSPRTTHLPRAPHRPGLGTRRSRGGEKPQAVGERDLRRGLLAGAVWQGGHWVGRAGVP